MSSLRSSKSHVRVFRQFSITNSWNSYREVLEQLQHGLDVIRRRQFQNGSNRARNGFEPIQLS